LKQIQIEAEEKRLKQIRRNKSIVKLIIVLLILASILYWRDPIQSTIVSKLSLIWRNWLSKKDVTII
jgi:hypothetical protein